MCSFFFIEANAQKKPVAVNDSVTTQYYSVNLLRPTANDNTFGQGMGFLDTVIHLGNYHLDSLKIIADFVIQLQYEYPTMGLDSFLYVMHPKNTPNLKDTAKIYVTIKYDYIEQSDTFETAFYKAIVNNAGPLFQDTRNLIAGFLIPKDSGTTTIFASNIWIAGKIGNKYQVSASTFNSDYSKNNPSPTNNHLYGGRPGPITNPSRLDEKGKREVESFLVSDAMGCFTV